MEGGGQGCDEPIGAGPIVSGPTIKATDSDACVGWCVVRAGQRSRRASEGFMANDLDLRRI